MVLLMDNRINAYVGLALIKDFNNSNLFPKNVCPSCTKGLYILTRRSVQR